MIPPLLAAIEFFVDGWGIITLKISTLITDTPPLAVVGIFISRARTRGWAIHGKPATHNIKPAAL